VLLILAAAVAGGLLTALARALTESPPAAPVSGGVSAAAVLEDPERFLGQVVRVNGRVTAVVSPRSVTLGEDGLLVLDIATTPAIDAVRDRGESLIGEAVQVAGEVREFHIDQIEAEVGSLDEDRFRVFTGRPVVLARSIDPSLPGP